MNKVVYASLKSTAAKDSRTVTNNYEERVQVEIVDLRDVYEKKTKKGPKGLEYRLENSKVTVKVHADLEITKVCAYVKRSARAAMRTHDNRGKLNFMAIMQDFEHLLCLAHSTLYML